MYFTFLKDAFICFSFIVYFAFESCHGKFAEGWYTNRLEELKAMISQEDWSWDSILGLKVILGFSLGNERQNAMDHQMLGSKNNWGLLPSHYIIDLPGIFGWLLLELGLHLEMFFAWSRAFPIFWIIPLICLFVSHRFSTSVFYCSKRILL